MWDKEVSFLNFLLLTEAIWDTKKIDNSDEEDFENESTIQFANALMSFYELGYKYHKLLHFSNSFQGHEKRYENIMNNVVTSFVESATICKDVLLKILHGWLRDHALTNRTKWAEGRIRFYNEDDTATFETPEGCKLIFERINVEYIDRLRQSKNISHYNRVPDINLGQYIQRDYAKKNELYKLIGNQIQTSGELDEFVHASYDDYEYDNKDNDNILTYDQYYDMKSEDNNYIEGAIDNMFDICDNNDTIELLYSNCNETYIKDIFVDILKKKVFPIWFSIFQPQGIVQTRKAASDIYNQLKSTKVKDIGNTISAISLALNAVHQSGRMIDHVKYAGVSDWFDIEIDGKSLSWDKFLDYLSNIDTTDWDNELKEAGLNIE